MVQGQDHAQMTLKVGKSSIFDKQLGL